MVDGKVHGTDCFEVDSVSWENFENFDQLVKSFCKFQNQCMIGLSQLGINPVRRFHRLIFAFYTL